MIESLYLDEAAMRALGLQYEIAMPEGKGLVYEIVDACAKLGKIYFALYTEALATGNKKMARLYLLKAKECYPNHVSNPNPNPTPRFEGERTLPSRFSGRQ